MFDEVTDESAFSGVIVCGVRIRDETNI